jgi:hypothetical protein
MKEGEWIYIWGGVRNLSTICGWIRIMDLLERRQVEDIVLR